MTAQLELERILDEFLGEGTDELSDHVLDAALGDITHTQQQHAWRVPRRFSDMPTPLRLLAAAAILATALGGAFVLGGTLNRDATPEPVPQPSPVTEDTAPIVLGAGPAGHYWAHRNAAFGWPEGDVGLQIPGNGLQALLGTGPNDEEVLLGTINNTGNRAILSKTDRCPEPGTYDWALTDNNLGFELTRVEDSCADRATFLEGGDWRRFSMVQISELGRRYELPVLDQKLSLTIPASFPAAGGIPPEIVVDLDQSDDLGHGLWVDSAGPDGLYFSVLTISPPNAYFNRCDAGQGRRNGPTTIEEFLAWNRRTTGATVSEPRETTVAGRPGIVVDITAGPDCPNSPEAYDMWDGLLAGMTQRQWAVPIGDRRLLIVGFVHTGPPFVPLTDKQLMIADELVNSITLE